MKPEQRFARIRARYLAARHRRELMEDELLRKYGSARPPWAWLTQGECDKADAIKRAEDKANDAMFELLDQFGTRRFRAGVPHWWVMEELTWEDATTSGPMSVVPPVAYGYTQRDSEAFAATIVNVLA